MELNRRQLLGTGLLGAASMLLPPEKLFAAMLPADWTLGVTDVDADITPRAMRRVHGRAPVDFKGLLYRNGPAKFRRAGGNATHWFDGDGLVRRFAIHEGEARLAARFVDTEKRRQESRAEAMVMPGFGTPQRPGAVVTGPDSANAANTSVMLAGDELWALWEGGSAYRLDPESLATVGPKTLRPDLAQMPFLAHPRTEPDGTVWNLGLAGARAMVWKLRPDGSLAAATPLKLPRASYIHDFTATARHLVIVLQPWVQARQTMPYSAMFAWQPELGTQVLVVDKDDLTQSRIFELPAFSFFHLGDAWEEKDGTIRFDGCVSDDPAFAMKEASDLLLGRNRVASPPMLAMVTLHADGRGELARTGIKAEFPQNDRRRAGLSRRFTAFAGLYNAERPLARGVGLFDWQRGTARSYDFGARQLVEEFLFVPRGADEGDGWLVGTTVNLDARATELHLLDARRIEAGPVAIWRADVALPVGFHGTFRRG
ncbi:carotenoid oxygenase family protein [Sphingomonas psychrotolerans]|uniref:Dioxygenase n=1 Tax=Sphingomonas psychrotolerans TaxID=1327635 RepID=A0ABU3N6H9_9SPHN|nr:carotenoid oxygenase family protein [Sphingomonas psychrotolerans]MDT8760137.1 carotenoid oxygenase family protein [Sphingomonas psychrotolerans]